MSILFETVGINGPAWFGIVDRDGVVMFAHHDGSTERDEMAAVAMLVANSRPEDRTVFFVTELTDDQELVYVDQLRRIDSCDVPEVEEFRRYQFVRSLQADPDITVLVPDHMSEFMATIPGDDPSDWVSCAVTGEDK
jgi:hypothetical protein